MVHNGGWYNKAGEKIGWGDLDANDIITIRDNIPENELFIILTEGDSYWKNVSFDKERPGWANIDRPTEMKPGKDFVAEHAMFIISHSQIYKNDQYGHHQPNETGRWHDRNGAIIEVTYIRRDKVKELILGN